jgi:hypothetical protein
VRGSKRTSGILAAKLVAREADDFKVVGVRGLEVLVQLLQTRKLWREAAFGRRVDDEDDFVGEIGERVWGAFFCVARWRVSYASTFACAGKRQGSVLSTGLKS